MRVARDVSGDASPTRKSLYKKGAATILNAEGLPLAFAPAAPRRQFPCHLAGNEFDRDLA